MDSERFTYYSTSQMIVDNLTGDTYHGNKAVTMLLNKESDKSDKIVESFDKWYEVLHKYNINTPEKLDQVLMNERVW